MSPSERAGALLARGLAALPGPVARLLAGSPIRIDGQTLHRDVQIGLRLEGLVGGSDILPVEEARARRRHAARIFAGPRIAVERVSDLRIPGPGGDIPARLYVPPDAGRSGPLVLYFHGGGHVIGDLDTHDQPCRFLARQTPARALAVDYRLAPEHRFPAAVDDALAAFRWAVAEAAALEADRARIALAGDSAGANLAAAVAQLARDADPPPAFQALLYPVLDSSSRDRASYELFGEGFFLTTEEMDWFRTSYFATEEERRDPRGSPLLAGDLSNLAPAFILSCGFDPLRDEAEEYADRLRSAGVATTLRREADLVHGFVNAVGLGGRAAEALGSAAAALRAGLAGAEAQPQRSRVSAAPG